MTIGEYQFNPEVRVDLAILKAMAAICSCVLSKPVRIDELSYLYEHDYTCRLEMTYVLCG